MWEGSCATAKSHLLADIVIPIEAHLALITWYSSLYSHSVSHFKPVFELDPGADGHHQAGAFMALREWLLDLDVSVAEVCVIVKIGPAQGCRFHRNLNLFSLGAADWHGNLMGAETTISMRMSISCGVIGNLPYEPGANPSARIGPEPGCCQAVVLG